MHCCHSPDGKGKPCEIDLYFVPDIKERPPHPQSLSKREGSQIFLLYQEQNKDMNKLEMTAGLAP